MAERFFLSIWKVYLILIFYPQQIKTKMQTQVNITTIAHTITMNLHESTWWHYLRQLIHSLSTSYRDVF